MHTFIDPAPARDVPENAGALQVRARKQPRGACILPDGDAAANGDGRANASDPNGAIPFDEVISKQLGLKLEKRKRRLQIVVIDHMELRPMEN
jgi:uncharacterized protein (TIGR03435 family)